VKLSDQRDIKASPDVVWAAILDPAVLMACVPGCESLTGSADLGYEAVVVQKVGPVKARFTGVVRLSDILPGQAVTLSGEGKGGPAGFAKGSARVVLAAEDGGTRLGYEVEANVGGKLAQLGSRIIDGFAKKIADQFFERLQQQIEGPREPEVTEAEAGTAGDGDKKGWLKRVFGD
jgi:carbon monoxide dehydrogenase subunit G